METVLGTFETALSIGRGDLLAQTLVPLAPSSNPNLLLTIRNSSSQENIDDDVKYGTVYNNNLSRLSLSKAQKQAWHSVYVAYWKCVCTVIDAEESEQGPPDALAKKWTAAYSAWGEVVRTITLGFQRQQFEVWTLPCLYVGGRYLRVFAIRADEAALVARRKGAAASKAGAGALSDDVADATLDEHETLEDAARRINSIFGLCISDRYVYLSEELASCSNVLSKTQCTDREFSQVGFILHSQSAIQDILPAELALTP